MTNTHSSNDDTQQLKRNQKMILLTLLLTVVAILATVTYHSSSSSSPPQRKLKSSKSSQSRQLPSYNPSDIKVPRDMWRRPSEHPDWHPVHLPDCCDDERARTETESHSKKFLICGCISDGDMLRYYGPGMGYTPEDLREALIQAGGDLILIGDSLSRQWFETLSCYLSAFQSWQGYTQPPIESHRAGFEADLTESFFRFRPSWRQRGNLGTVDHTYSSVGSFEIPGTHQRVMLHEVNEFTPEEVRDVVEYYDQRYPRDFSRARPLFVINFGLHYNLDSSSGNTKHYINNDKRLKRDLGNIASYCKDEGARCIFRETSPQHFTNPDNDGVWHVNRGPRCMKSPPPTFDTLSRWRNDVLYEVIKEVGGEGSTHSGGFMKVMPLFDKLLGLDLYHHRTAKDCTHFKMDPELWEPWHVSLTETLTDVVTQIAR